MILRIPFLFLAFGLCLFWSCNTPEQKAPAASSASSDTTFHQTDIRYAEQFNVSYADGYKIVEVLQPFPGAEKGHRYLLLPKGMEVPANVEADAIVRIPVQEMVALSTTHIPALDMLDASNVLTGFPTTDFISSPTMRQRIDSGKVRDLGASNGLNIEGLLELSPGLVMAYGMGPQDKSLRSLERTGIPVVLNADFLEQNPLGRAEWIKFAALFLNKEKEADSVFNAIVQKYESLTEKAAAAEERPSVFSGIVYNGTWFMPGGNSWAARFLEDAGANFLWSETKETGSLQLSFESVFDKAHQADYWIGTANFNSLKVLAEADSRYSRLDAWKQGNVFTYTARIGEAGGNEYLELGYSRPDIVLADLIKILHPELLPGHNLYFYEKLE
jgi:iron complex transport system substrate-binding protein